MFNLIPISLLIVSLGGIVYIISNHLSEFSEGDENEEENDGNSNFKLKARFAEWVNQLPLDKAKSQSFSLAQKLLHKSRLFLLKADNHLMKLIDKISRQEKQEKIEDPGFWDEFAKIKRQEEVVPPAVEPMIEPEIKINLVVKSVAAGKALKIKRPKK